MRQVTGGFVLHEIVSSTDTEVQARVSERDWPENVGVATMTVEPEPPHHILSAQVRLAPGGGSTSARLSEEQALAELRSKLDQFSASGQFIGAVMVARDGEPVFKFASGEADREQGIPNTIDTKFRNGSMNKMFTAVAVLQLVEAGRIDLNATIGEYLTDYPNADLASRVTIRQLLTHTGGTGDIFSPEYFERRLETREVADYIALFGARDVKFEPGSRYEYSNYGFILLGAIVEAVSGEHYYDYVDEHIFAPAGMTSTGSLPEDVEVPGRAVAYTAPPGQTPRPATDTLPYRGSPAGGGYSTVGDFVRFSEALKSGALLGPEMLAMATSTQIEAGPGGGYGYGFGTADLNGVRSFGHSGGAPGMSAELLVLPDSGYAVAIASNTDGQLVPRLVRFVGARLPAEP
jgi:CubicO group peptidase (beta-lactamase class C family)